MDDMPKSDYEQGESSGVLSGHTQAIQEVAGAFWRSTLRVYVAYVKDTPPGLIKPETAIDATCRHIEYLNAKIERLEAALTNRDNVDKLACMLMDTILATQVTHGQKNGMIKLVQEFLGKYHGQRNAADPIVPPSDDASDIPF